MIYGGSWQPEARADPLGRLLGAEIIRLDAEEREIERQRAASWKS
jgi:hypothetical protein